jgi:hypothetical protein
LKKGRGSYRRALTETLLLWALGLGLFLVIKRLVGF